jgi:hypothetical protein
VGDPYVAYAAIRQEIVANHVLMHAVTLVAVIVLLGGVWLAERRRTVLSVFLPLFAVTWAASMLRFEFFIQRQGAFLRDYERYLVRVEHAGPTWELWKAGFTPTQVVVPLADVFTFVGILAPALYLAFVPGRSFLADRTPALARIFPWAILVVLLGLLAGIGVIPLALRS